MAGNIQAGQLRHKIRIESRTAVSDGQGGSTHTWGLHAHTWAMPDETDPAADVYAGGVVDSTTTRFICRYVPGVTSAMRVVHDGTTYAIMGVRNVQHRNRRTELLCREARDGSS